MQPPYESIPLTFFVPGETYLILEHERSLQGQALIERLRRHPLVLSDDRLAAAIENVRPADVVSITGPNDSLASGCNWIVSLLMRSLGIGGQQSQAANRGEGAEQPRRITSMVFARVPQFTAPENQRAFIEDFIGLLNNRAKELQQDGDELTVETIAPNWLGGSAPGQFGMGGPGAKPVPAYPDQRAQPWAFKMPDRLGRDVRGKGQPVEVAVLDTVPAWEALNHAFHSPALADHELLQRVKVQTTGGLNVFRPITDSMEHNWLNDPQLGIALRDHFYNMSDHGLFVAGVIAAIAPQAQIRMVEVLSHWGIGTMQTIANGLNQLLSQRNSKVPLVVNLSLTIEVPSEDHLPPGWQNDSQLSQWAWFVAWLKENENFIEESFAALRKLCAQLEATGAIIIAAAGNNGTSDAHPPARYPAAFHSVTGVGALKHNGETAEYSNEADRPDPRNRQPLAGMVTFGGDMDMTSGNANTETGMLGVYIGAFPDGSVSQNGWARWAGTSFATPVIAGTLARLIAAGDRPQEAMQRIRDVQSAIDADLGSGEIFTAVQGG